MQFFIIILAVSLVIFFFSVHVLAKEDLTFVRKNLTLEVLFNYGFYVLGVGILSARVLYVIEHFSLGFLNPLVFFLFPYFPGLSIAGGVWGAVIFILVFKPKSYPVGRILDCFSVSFLATLPIGFFGQGLLLGMHDKFSGLFMPIIFLFTLVFFIKVLLPLNVRGELEDGSLGFILLIVFSFTTLVSFFVRAKAVSELLFQLDFILLFILLLFSIIMLALNEKRFSFIRNRKGLSKW